MSTQMFSYPEPSPPPDDPPPSSVAPQSQTSKSEADWAPGRVRAVNLLPPTLRLRAAVSQARARAIIAIVVAAVIVMALAGLATSGRLSAESELAMAQQRVATAEAEKSQYSDVPGVYAAIAEAQKELSTAMGQEVQFSGLLTNLGLTIPPRVSLSAVTMTVGAAASGKKSSNSGSTSGPDLGSVTLTGQAATMPDVAAFLDALATLPEYTAIHLESATSSSGGTGVPGGTGTSGGTVQYSISAQLTEKALSGRFGTPATAPSAAGRTASQSAPTAGGSHG